MTTSSQHTRRYQLDELSSPQLLFGFRRGEKGTHTSRTIMLQELSKLLSSIAAGAAPEEYATRIVTENILDKPTTATRRLTFQRLKELFALDPSVTVFRTLRHYWERDELARPLLALLCGLARDPLLRATSTAILDTRPGEDLSKQVVKNALENAIGERLNESVLDKVVRNAASSWTQSGHLAGRSRKIRKRVSCTPASCAYALLLGYLEGFRGQSLIESSWTRVLDCAGSELIAKAIDAKRMGLLDLKIGGDVIDIGFGPVLTDEERSACHGTH